MKIRWYAELYPLYDAKPVFIQANGRVGRMRATFPTKREANEAVKKFYNTRFRSLLMDHELFVDKLEAQS